MNSAVAGAAVIRDRAANPAVTADKTAWLGPSTREVVWLPAGHRRQPPDTAVSETAVPGTTGYNVPQVLAAVFTQRSILTTR